MYKGSAKKRREHGCALHLCVCGLFYCKKEEKGVVDVVIMGLYKLPKSVACLPHTIM